MKKLLLTSLLCCFAGLICSCDKDDDYNPFAGTVWKCSCYISFPLTTGGIGSVPGYKVFRFNANMTYEQYEENDDLVVVNRTGEGRYSLNRKDGRMTFYWSWGEEKGTMGYHNGLPWSFTTKNNDTGEEFIYVRQ